MAFSFTLYSLFTLNDNSYDDNTGKQRQTSSRGTRRELLGREDGWTTALFCS